MKFIVFDKAKWYWGVENVPTGIPSENGGTCIAFFLRWYIEQKFCSKQMWEDFPYQLKSIENNEGKIDCRKLFYLDMDGVLSIEELNKLNTTCSKEPKTNNILCHSQLTKNIYWKQNRNLVFYSQVCLRLK
jgi:hypothetical protein